MRHMSQLSKEEQLLRKMQRAHDKWTRTFKRWNSTPEGGQQEESMADRESRKLSAYLRLENEYERKFAWWWQRW